MREGAAGASERWLQQLDFECVSRFYAEQRYSEVPTFTWPEPDFNLTFSPIPKSEEARGRAGVRPVGAIMPLDIRLVRTHDDIRAAVEGKATKYGATDLPLVIAVNVVDDFFDDVDVLNALFGEEQIVAIRQADGRCRDVWALASRTGRGVAVLVLGTHL